MSRRTTSFITPPAASTMCLIFLNASCAWLYIEPSPSTPPLPSPAVMPATKNWSPWTRQFDHVPGAGSLRCWLVTRCIFMKAPPMAKAKPKVSKAGRPGDDPVASILPDQREALRAIFAPRSVAVIGATEKDGSVGRTLTWNLIAHPFGRPVFPVNPRRASVLGIKAYPDLASLPEPADLAVIVTPAATVPGVVAECVRTGVKGAIVISAGFQETGAAGAAPEG